MGPIDFAHAAFADEFQDNPLVVDNGPQLEGLLVLIFHDPAQASLCSYARPGLNVNRDNGNVVPAAFLDRLLNQPIADAVFRRGFEDLLDLTVGHHVVQPIGA